MTALMEHVAGVARVACLLATRMIVLGLWSVGAVDRARWSLMRNRGNIRPSVSGWVARGGTHTGGATPCLRLP